MSGNAGGHADHAYSWDIVHASTENRHRTAYAVILNWQIRLKIHRCMCEAVQTNKAKNRNSDAVLDNQNWIGFMHVGNPI